MSLTASLESALDSAAPTAAPDGQQAPDPGQTGQPAEETPSQSFVGLPPEQPTGQEGTPTPEAGKFKLELAPETVVALDQEGKPITAGEFQSGYMRYSDYTRKNQEFSEYRSETEPVMGWFNENRSVIEALGSDDPEERLNALLHVAKENDIDLGQARSRGTDGRFTAQQSASGVDLDAIAQQHGEDSVAYQIAVQNQALQSRLDRLEKDHTNFTQGLQTSFQRQQQQSEAERVASEWGKGGFTADVGSAMKMVGQPITPEQAMQLSHFEKIMRHNIAVAKGGSLLPNDPASGSRPRASMAGKSLSQAIGDAFHSSP